MSLNLISINFIQCRMCKTVSDKVTDGDGVHIVGNGYLRFAYICNGITVGACVLPAV